MNQQHPARKSFRAVTLKILAATAVAAAIGSFVAQPVFAQNKEPVVIGAVISATGPLALAGLPERDGMLLAQKILNAGGGIKGQMVELAIEDDASSPDTAVSKANTLIFSRKVKGLLGATGIASTVAMGGISSAQKLPHIAFSGLGPAVEKDRSCVFHLTPAQELNARGVFAYMSKALKVKKVGVLYDSGYGQSVYNAMKAIAGEYGLDITNAEKFEIGATDITTQAAKIKSENPEAVAIVTTNPIAFRHARQVKITVPIVATHPSAPYETVKLMGDAADDVVFADFMVAEEPLPHQKEFVDAFKRQYGRLPKNFEAVGYDGVMMMAKAIEQSGGASDKICAVLRQQPYQGQLAQYDLRAADLGGLTPASFVYSKFANGKFTRLSFKAQ